MKNAPRAWRWCIAYGVATPVRSETMRAVLAPHIAPPHGSQPSNIVLSRPVPRVDGEELAAEADERRAPGTRNSRRARPKPWFVIFVHAAAALAEALGHDADVRFGRRR